MKYKKFIELDFFLENYIVNIENRDVISKSKNISIIKKTQRGHEICKLYRNGVCSVYTLNDILAYKAGILNKKNYNLNIKAVGNELKAITISEQNKISNTGKALINYWNLNGYKKRDREYKYKYDYLIRNKIYNYKNINKMKNSDISKKLNIPKCTIGRILKDFSPCPKEDSGIALWIDKNLSEEDKETILYLYKNKAKINDICNMFKVPKNIVKRIGSGDLW